tara:strand:- start:1154 stop:2803 length:1650 start_codon:yes stop_codon:yes gene_type:complete
MASTSWETLSGKEYVGLHPWAWIEFESSNPLGPFPFLGGVDPKVVSCLDEVHRHLSGALDIAISEVFTGRAPLKDDTLPERLENAYAEVVQSRPHLREVIRCGRKPDGTFEWEFPLDEKKSSPLSYSRLQVLNSHNRQSVPFGLDPSMAPVVGQFIGCLNGTLTVANVQAEIDRIGQIIGEQAKTYLLELLNILLSYDCLALSKKSTIRQQWLDAMQDRDILHTGHAGLVYRQKDNFLFFDPWLVPWYAEAPLPSLWPSLLPKPAGIFLTHDHDDHVDPRTLLMFPKDTPIIVPSRKNKRALYYDYLSFLKGLGYTKVIELAHWETWDFEGGKVVSIPFYGECSCEMGMPRNTYMIVDRGRNIYNHCDSGPTNTGENALKDGVFDEMVKKYGPVDTVFCQPGQLLELRTYAAYASLSPPGKWLEIGENCCVTTDYLAGLVGAAKARLFVSFANGCADWLSDHPVFVFHRRNPALKALLTAYWWPVDELKEKLTSKDCQLTSSFALDLFREQKGGITQQIKEGAPKPIDLYRAAHGEPPFKEDGTPIPAS